MAVYHFRPRDEKYKWRSLLTMSAIRLPLRKRIVSDTRLMYGKQSGIVTRLEYFIAIAPRESFGI